MRYQRPQIARGVGRYLNIPGGAGDISEVDEHVYPQLIIGDLTDSPYMVGAMGTSGAFSKITTAFAAELSYIIVQPSVNVALQIMEVGISNQGAAASAFNIFLLTAAQVAAVIAATGGTAAATDQLVATTANPAGSSKLSSFMRSGQTSAAAVNGQLLRQFFIPAGSEWDVPIARPGFVLFGDDTGGLPGLMVSTGTAAQALRASVQVREWALPLG